MTSRVRENPAQMPVSWPISDLNGEALLVVTSSANGINISGFEKPAYRLFNGAIRGGGSMVSGFRSCSVFVALVLTRWLSLQTLECWWNCQFVLSIVPLNAAGLEVQSGSFASWPSPARNGGRFSPFWMFSAEKVCFPLSVLFAGGLRPNGSVQAEFQEHHRPSAHGPGWDSAHEAAGSGLWSRHGLLRGEDVIAEKSK